jgi:hypothetical protein
LLSGKYAGHGSSPVDRAFSRRVISMGTTPLASATFCDPLTAPFYITYTESRHMNQMKAAI